MPYGRNHYTNIVPKKWVMIVGHTGESPVGSMRASTTACIDHCVHRPLILKFYKIIMLLLKIFYIFTNYLK